MVSKKQNDAKVVREERELDPLDEQMNFSWQAESRLHKKRGKDFYSTILILALLISVIMFFIEGVIPVLLIWSIVFVIWAITKIPPEMVEYQITNKGIRTHGELYQWEEMVFFWIEKKESRRLFRVVLNRRFPGQLGLIVKVKDEKRVRELIRERIDYRRPNIGWLDRLVAWVQKKVPLES